MRLTGARILMECLRAEGVEVFFGYPGGVVLPLYNTLGEYPDIKHVLVRHEQAAAHAADGYARVAGRTGVCLATSGPGATNLVTGITTAYMDSVPMVVLTGNVARDLSGRALVAILTNRFGYHIVHQRGSHIVLETLDPSRHRVVVPDHPAIRIGTLNSVLRAVAAHKGIDRGEILGQGR